MTATQRSKTGTINSKSIGISAILLLLYPLILSLSNHTAFVSGNTPWILPACGLLTAMFLLSQYRFWPLLVGMVTAAHLLTEILIFDQSFLASLITVGAGLIAALASARLLNYLNAGQTDNGNPAQTFKLLLVLSFFAAPASALLHTTGYFIIFDRIAVWTDVQQLWFATAIGALAITPAIIALYRVQWNRPGSLSKAVFFERVLFFGALIGSTEAIFGSTLNGELSTADFSYLILPILLWSAIRFTAETTAFALTTVLAIIFWNFYQHSGPFFQPTSDTFEPVLSLQIYCASISVSVLSFAAAISGIRRHVSAELLSANVLRNALNATDLGYWYYDKDFKLQAWNERRSKEQSVNQEYLGMPMVDDILAWAKTGWYGPGDPGKIARDLAAKTVDGTLAAYEEIRSPRGRLYAIRHFYPDEGGVVQTQVDITREKLAESSALKSEALFEAFLANSSGLITIKDVTGRYSHMSDEFYRLFDLKPDQVVGHFPDEFFDKEIARKITEGDDAVIRSGESWQKEIDVATPEGIKSFNSVRFPVKDSHDKLIAVGGIAIDITEFRQQQKILNQSEQEYRELVEGSIQGILVHDAEQTLFVNQAFADIFGYSSAEEVVGLKSRFELCASYEQERLKNSSLRRLAGENPPEAYEFDGVKSNGSIIRLSAIARRVRWKGQLALQFVVVDVTEKTRAAENVRHNEIRYRSLFDMAPMALVEQDWSKAKELVDRLSSEDVKDIRSYLIEHPKLIYQMGDLMEARGVNQVALEMFQSTSRSEYINWANNLPSDHIREELIDRTMSLIAGETKYQSESTSVRMGGESFPVLITSHKVGDDPNDWSQVYTSILDLSELKKATTQKRELELRQLRLFESAPVALFESDWTRGKILIDQLKAQGITDIAKHLKDNPGIIRKRSDMGVLTNVNEEALRIYRVESKEELIRWIQHSPIETLPVNLIDRMASHAAGTRRDSHESTSQRHNGENFSVFVTSEIISQDLDDWSQMLTMELDISEQKKAEQNLRDSENRYRQMFNFAPVALLVQDWSKGKKMIDSLVDQGLDLSSHLQQNPQLIETYDDVSHFVNANQEVLRIFKFDDQDLYKTWMGSTLSNSRRHSLQQRLVRFHAGESRVSIETILTRLDGTPFPALLTSEIVRDESNSWSRVFTTISDLTEQRQAELELRDREEKFRNLAEGSLQGIIVADIDWNLEFANTAIAEMLNYADLDEFMSLGNWQKVVPDHELERMRDYQFQRLRGENPPNQYELRLKTCDGQQIDCLVGVRLIDWNHAPAFQFAIFDFSDLKEAQSALTESVTRFQAFMDNTPDPITIADEQGRYTFINRGFEKLYGIPAEQLYGQLPDHLEAEEDRMVPIEEDRLVREQKQIRTRYQTSRFNGEEQFWYVTRFPIIDSDGKLVGTGGISRDITQQRRSEVALQQSEQNYRQLFEYAPIALYQQDWSPVKKMIDDLRAEGITDLYRHLLDHLELTSHSHLIGTILNVNQEALKTYGAKNKELYTQVEKSTPLEEIQPHLIERICQLASGNRQATTGGNSRRLNGDFFPVLTNTVILGDDLEDWSLIYTSELDISDLRKAEKAMQQSEQRFRHLFDAAPVSLAEQDWTEIRRLVDDLQSQGIADIGAHLRQHPELIGGKGAAPKLVDVNLEALRIYQAQSKEEFFQSLPVEFWPAGDESLIERTEEFLNGNHRIILQTESTRSDGSSFPIRLTTQLASIDATDWSSVYTSDQDITEEMLSAARLSTYRDELRKLAGQMSLAEERERRRISSDLHDGTIQNLIVARMHIATLEKSLRSEKSLLLAANINSLLESSLKEARSMIFELSPPILYELGLKAGIEWLAGQFNERTGIHPVLDFDDADVTLSEELRIVIFQATREFLVNIAKHANATKVTISWKGLADTLEVKIIDNGIGFDVTDVGSKSSQEGGFGIFSLRERLGLLGANFAIESSPNQGTCVTLIAPQELIELDKSLH